MSYDAVIFDNDGVIVRQTHDTDTIRQQIEQALRQRGADPDPEQIDTFTWANGRRAIELACQDLGIDAPDFWEQRERICSQIQQQEIREGIKDLYPDTNAIEELSGRLPLGIVSNNQQQTIDFVVDYFGLEDRFQTRYGREPGLEGVSRKKPAPYYLRLAEQDLGATEPLYVGDSRTDVQAAHNAGMDAAFIRRPHREGYTLDEEPEHEIDGLHDVIRLL